eukprot:1186401-Prorocentrum_minimum.AAC.1
MSAASVLLFKAYCSVGQVPHQAPDAPPARDALLRLHKTDQSYGAHPCRYWHRRTHSGVSASLPLLAQEDPASACQSGKRRKCCGKFRSTSPSPLIVPCRSIQPPTSSPSGSPIRSRRAFMEFSLEATLGNGTTPPDPPPGPAQCADCAECAERPLCRLAQRVDILPPSQFSVFSFAEPVLLPPSRFLPGFRRRPKRAKVSESERK